MFPTQADVHARGGSRQRTALHYASLHNHIAVATRLLSAGANEHCCDATGQTALNLSMGGEMCKLLHKVAPPLPPYLTHSLLPPYLPLLLLACNLLLILNFCSPSLSLSFSLSLAPSNHCPCAWQFRVEMCSQFVSCWKRRQRERMRRRRRGEGGRGGGGGGGGGEGNG